MYSHQVHLCLLDAWFVFFSFCSTCSQCDTASTYGLLHDQLRALPEIWRPLQETSFKFSFQSLNRSIPSSQQVEIINSFAWMQLQGKIDMLTPEVIITVIEEHSRSHSDKSLRSVWIGTHLCTGRRDLIDVFNIKKRKYFGNTTMDAEVSLLMANQAQVCFSPLRLRPV